MIALENQGAGSNHDAFFSGIQSKPAFKQFGIVGRSPKLLSNSYGKSQKIGQNRLHYWSKSVAFKMLIIADLFHCSIAKTHVVKRSVVASVMSQVRER